MDGVKARKLAEEVSRLRDAEAALIGATSVAATEEEAIDAAEQYASCVRARNAAYDAAAEVELGERASGTVGGGDGS